MDGDMGTGGAMPQCSRGADAAETPTVLRGELPAPICASREPPEQGADPTWGLRLQGYLGAMVEVINTGGVHEGLVEVGAGVDAARDDELASGIDDLGTAGDHQLAPNLLDDAILNVDVGLKGAVVVHHLPPLDEDPHGGRIGHHGAAGQRQHWGDH